MVQLRAGLVGAAASILCTLLLLTTAYARADEPAPQPFDIQPQSLSAALAEFARQSHEEILFAPEVVAQKRSGGVRGTMQPLVALKVLLKDSGIPFSSTPNGAFLVGTAGGGSSSASAVSGQLGTDDPKEGQKSADSFRVAQLDQTSAGPQALGNSDPDKKKKDEEISEIVVTGSRIARPLNENAQDVHVFTKQQIDQSGQTTIPDFLNTLPSVSLSTGENSFQTSGGATTVSLRGLPFGTTLVLINGRRVETSGSQSAADFFDLNNIPLAAVERIEVVADGSSAVYGSDAIAGVVNIILRHDFNGLEASVKYGRANETDESNASLAFGKQWSRGSLSIMGSYQARDGLNTSERALTANNDYTAFGGPNANFPYCNPGNVFSLDGSPLPGAPAGSNASTAAVSGRVTSGKPAFGDFNFGAQNSCAFASGVSLIPDTHRAGVFVQGSLELSPSVNLFTEVMYSHVEELQKSFLQALSATSVSATNPFNPFGIDVGVNETFNSVRSELNYDTDFFRPLVGVRGHFLNDWEWEFTASRSSDRTSVNLENYIPNYAAIQDALDSPNPSVALNPFVANPLGTQAQLKGLFSNGLDKFMGRDDAVIGFIRGPLFRLPAGAIDVVAGGEYHHGTVESDLVDDGFDPPNTRTQFERRSYSAFGEARVPILAYEPNVKWSESLVATVAGRFDHYSDFGKKVTPQVGLEWHPMRSLQVRGTFSEAFKAPPLPDLYTPVTVSPANTAINDPKTGQQVIVSDVSGGNRNLRPLTGQSHTFGVVYSSLAIPDLRLSLTRWSVLERDTIIAVGDQFIVNNESEFPGRVVRDASGTITQVINTNQNFGSIKVTGIDYQVNYIYQSRFGTWTPSISATETDRYAEALVPGSPTVDAAGKAQDGTNAWAPKWKGSAALGWALGPFNSSIDGRYVGRYQDYGSTREIGKFWLCDANVRFNAGKMFAPDNRALGGTFLEIGAVNLFDRLPQYSNYSFSLLGYDPAQADIRGRFLYIRLGANLK